MTSVTKVALHGSRGRMGIRIAACAEEDPEVEISAAYDRGEGSGSARQATAPQKVASIDVVIDFSSDEGAREAAALAERHRAGLLVGTTSLSPATLERIAAAERLVPVMVAANTSLGVAVARRLVAEAARLLGPGYDIDVVETHHTKKVDAPSGTALALVASLREGGRPLPAERVHAIRAGDVVGDHLVQFAGPGEILRIEHHAITRDLFAKGALRAAKWLRGRAPGRYRIEDTFAG
jgi:4-hydroxy-tetrahydrodipicolinate reductase